MLASIPDYPVSRDFYHLLLKTYPALRNRADYRHLLGYIIYGSWTDIPSGELIIPGSLLSSMQGKSAAYDSKHYNGKVFLAEFSRDVFVVEWRSHNLYAERIHARRIISTELDSRIQRAAMADLHMQPSIWLGSGLKYDRRKADSERKNTESAIQNSRVKPKCVEAERVLSYLNGSPSTAFTSIFNKNFREAVNAIDELPFASRDREVRILRAIQCQPKPYYRAVRGSSRLYPANPSLLHLRREVRGAFTKGWIEADLRGAQLAIIAKLWNCPITLKILHERVSIWGELSNQAGISFNAHNKSSIKELVYRAAFGSSKKNIKKEGSKLIGQVATLKLLRGPIFSELLIRRNEYMKVIESQEFAIDAFDNHLPYDPNAKNHLLRENRVWGQSSNLLSLLAEQAQSYELKLLYPVFQAVTQFDKADRHAFDVRSLLYDGFTFTCRDSKDIPSTKRFLKSLVKAEAHSLGIPTELEIVD